MSQASFRRLLRGDAALAPRLLMALLRQDETRRPGRKRKAPKPMAGLRPHRADSPAARLLAEGGVDDYRVPLTTSQADSYRQVYAQIQTLGAAAISTAQLASHMSMEALLVDSHLSPAAFDEMLTKACIDQDDDGELTLDEVRS